MEVYRGLAPNEITPALRKSFQEFIDEMFLMTEPEDSAIILLDAPKFAYTEYVFRALINSPAFYSRWNSEQKVSFAKHVFSLAQDDPVFTNRLNVVSNFPITFVENNFSSLGAEQLNCLVEYLQELRLSLTLEKFRSAIARIHSGPGIY